MYAGAPVAAHCCGAMHKGREPQSSGLPKHDSADVTFGIARRTYVIIKWMSDTPPTCQEQQRLIDEALDIYSESLI